MIVNRIVPTHCLQRLLLLDGPAWLLVVGSVIFVASSFTTMPRKIHLRGIDAGTEMLLHHKPKPEDGSSSGHSQQARRQTGVKLLTFSHPDFTVGSGIPPDHALLR